MLHRVCGRAEETTVTENKSVVKAGRQLLVYIRAKIVIVVLKRKHWW